MQKSIIAYIAVFVVLILFVYFTYGVSHAPTSTTTIIQTSTIQQQNVTTTILANITTTTTIPQGSCLSSNPTAAISNGDFGLGNYSNWAQTGGGFGSGPQNITHSNSANVMAYYNHTWTNYLGNFFASTFTGGLGVQPGNLTSDPFIVTEPYLNFRIISSQHQLLYVEILQGNQTMIATHYNTYVPGNPYPTSLFLNASLPMSSLLCQNVSIRIVSGVVGTISTSRTYIAIGDFVLSKTPVVNPGIANPNQIIVNQTIKGVNG